MRRSSRIQLKDSSKPQNDSTRPVTSAAATKDKPRVAKKPKTSNSAANSTQPKQAKKVKASASKSRGKRGFLEKLAEEAPLDVVLEIFTHLYPLDILHLARTSKDLRGILMSRSSSHIWKAARENADRTIPGLPPLPADLSEPQYASLAFDPTCQVCFRGPCENVVWECHFRCHKNCASKVFYSLDELSKLKTWNKDVEAMMQRGIEGGFIPRYEDRKLFGDEAVYLPSIIKSLRLEYQEIKDNQKELEKWERAKRERYSTLRNFGGQCEHWNQLWTDHCAMVRHCDELALQRQRRNEINERLKSLGWSDEDLLQRDFANHPLVNQTKELTNRAWTTIQPILVEHLEQLKEKRLEQAYASRHVLLKTVYDFHCKMNCKSEYDVFPPIGDFILSPQAQAINDLIWNTPREQEVTQPQFIRTLLHQTDFGVLIKEWKAGIHKQLKADPESAVFRCRHCREVLWVPRLYAHKCLLSSVAPVAPLEWVHPEANFNPFVDFHWSTWSSHLLEYSEPATSYRARVQEMCEAEDLRGVDEMDPLFACRECSQVFGWTRAIAHQHNHTLLIVKDEVLVSAARNEMQPPVVRPDTVLCQLCKSTPPPAHWTATIYTHLKTRHGIEEQDAKRGVHWVWKPDTPFDSLQSRPLLPGNLPSILREWLSHGVSEPH
ncbi:hypothetical protein PQX77_017721 [Marasmius sp. AFHP31]|nr:hypothetical protein PQX77_017721 [Marasmius sp. AFHP31]